MVRGGRPTQEAAPVGGLFHFQAGGPCRLLADTVPDCFRRCRFPVATGCAHSAGAVVFLLALVDERCLQPDLVGADRIVPVASLQAEILTLRHQLNVLRRKSPQRLQAKLMEFTVETGANMVGQPKKAR
jgi:hypothetical protein